MTDCADQWFFAAVCSPGNHLCVKDPQVFPAAASACNDDLVHLFALIQLLTSGGPNHSTDTIMYYIYYTAFKLYRYGYGNAMGVVLAVIIAILSAVQFKLGNQDN